ncbi:aldehyde dehydrogenase (NADP(+)) [Dactylosporangium sp. NPDC000521]|uniref:aldehyde dehydrogenase (NADP(+)) n=1 Tax=Dactylosporangium sp. NPDC000521 TaxID=3363975 RepID=UPI0036A5AE73
MDHRRHDVAGVAAHHPADNSKNRSIKISDLEIALSAAAACAGAAGNATPHERANWLRAAADRLEGDRDRLIELARTETRLDHGRLSGELTRTVFQARLFADELEAGNLTRETADPADPDWGPPPRPALTRRWVAIGPVAVFAASNFPFAFSVFGGDTVSALAAGCPVVVKAHPGHPELSRAVAREVMSALTAAGAPQGTLSLVEGIETGRALVADPRIKAVGFTGSQAGGRALFDIAVGRADPIPFYGELGATNPVVVTPDGWRDRRHEIVAGFAASFTLSAGQFCTKPGVLFVPGTDDFVKSMPEVFPGPMLNPQIEERFHDAVTELAAMPGVAQLWQGPETGDGPRAELYGLSGADALADPSPLMHECFGPAALLVEYSSLDQLSELLDRLSGTLTATIQAGDSDDVARTCVAPLAAIAGRVIWNQWPTGVAVTHAQQHGGPWPATTAPLSTSVGTAAIQRFLRPVAFQNFPF